MQQQRQSTRLAITLLCALGLGACNQQAGHAGAAGQTMPPPEVAIVQVGSGDTPVTRDLQARMTAYRTAEVRARVEGILEKRLFTEGGEVKAGQSLFRIDSRTLQAEQATAKAALARSQATLLMARQTVERYRVLVKDQGVSKQEMDQAEASFKQAEADVASNQAALTRANINLGYSQVQAPISGRITRALVTEGALVGHNEATHLATIEQLDPINVTFSQSGTEVLAMRQALLRGKLQSANSLPVDLVLANGTRYEHQGKLLFAEQTVDASTGTVTLRAEFPNPDRLLLPGMFGTVRVAQASISNAIRIPQRAVMLSQQGSSVYVVGEGNKVAIRPVKTGGLSGTDWIITEGLKAGDRVIVEGLQKVKPEAVVVPTPYGASKPASATQAAAH